MTKTHRHDPSAYVAQFKVRALKQLKIKESILWIEIWSLGKKRRRREECEREFL